MLSLLSAYPPVAFHDLLNFGGPTSWWWICWPPPLSAKWPTGMEVAVFIQTSYPRHGY